MKIKNRKIISGIGSFFVVAAFLSNLSCIKGEHSNPLDPEFSGQGTLPSKDISGIISLPQNSSLQPTDLSVLSPLSESQMMDGGEFIINTIEGEKPQILIAPNSAGEPILLAPAMAHAEFHHFFNYLDSKGLNSYESSVFIDFQ